VCNTFAGWGIQMLTSVFGKLFYKSKMMYLDIFFGENVDVNESKKAEVGIDTSIFLTI
jgi:hypothetical protein